MFNDISGTVHDALMSFDTALIWLLAQDGAVVKNNRLAIPGNDLADGMGVAIVANDACCGFPVSFSTTINSVIVNNDGRGSEVAVYIPLDGDGFEGNTVGTTLRGNFGVNIINDDEVDVENRSIHTLVEFLP